jgi:trans-aconitate 2-methyltransferase
MSPHLAIHAWDAATYTRISEPQVRWAGPVIERLGLHGDEVVLDAGCGSGRVTEQLLTALPQGRVIGLDASPAMLSEARERLGHDARVTLVLADLGGPLALPEPVDCVFSNATFHWVVDHERLFANLAGVLKPDGHLSAQCGGAGNIASVLRAVEEVGGVLPYPCYFAGAEETEQRLMRLGFIGVETWLQDEPTSFEPGEPFETYLSTVVLRPYVRSMGAEQGRDFVSAVAKRLPSAELDYVRLNIVATRE